MSCSRVPLRRRELYMAAAGPVYLLLLIASVCHVQADSREEEMCGGRPADIVFLLDTSNSIWQPDFHKQLHFVKEVVSRFDIGKDMQQVAVVTFSTDVNTQFNLNAHSTKHQLKKAISGIKQGEGIATNTGDALRYMRETCFQPENGGRGDDVTKIGIVITDGMSSDTELTAFEANVTRESGIHLFAIGVGDSVEMDELNAIASTPRDHYVFHTRSFAALKYLSNLLAVKTCTVTERPTTAPPARSTTPLNSKLSAHAGNTEIGAGVRPADQKLVQKEDSNVCGCGKPADIVFVLDEKEDHGQDNGDAMWDFVTDAVSDLDKTLGTDDVTVRFVRPCVEIPEIKLNEFEQKQELLEAFKDVPAGPQSSADLLNQMTNLLSDHDNVPAEQARRKIGVYLTDGPTNNLTSSLEAAHRARLDNDIELFGVGVGQAVVPTELRGVVSCPVEEHLIVEPEPCKLPDRKDQFLNQLCHTDQN